MELPLPLLFSKEETIQLHIISNILSLLNTFTIKLELLYIFALQNANLLPIVMYVGIDVCNDQSINLNSKKITLKKNLQNWF